MVNFLIAMAILYVIMGYCVIVMAIIVEEYEITSKKELFACLVPGVFLTYHLYFLIGRGITRIKAWYTGLE